MLHEHDNVELDTTYEHMTNSLKYTQHVCPTRFEHDTASRWECSCYIVYHYYNLRTKLWNLFPFW